MSSCPTVALAQQTAPDPRPWPQAVTADPFKENPQAAYLTSVLNLLDREQEAMADESMRQIYLDFLATHLAFVGEQARATRAGDQAYGSVEPQAVRPEG